MYTSTGINISPMKDSCLKRLAHRVVEKLRGRGGYEGLFLENKGLIMVYSDGTYTSFNDVERKKLDVWWIWIPYSIDIAVMAELAKKSCKKQIQERGTLNG